MREVGFEGKTFPILWDTVCQVLFTILLFIVLFSFFIFCFVLLLVAKQLRVMSVFKTVESCLHCGLERIPELLVQENVAVAESQ